MDALVIGMIVTACIAFVMLFFVQVLPSEEEIESV
jgi:hypothetical protein